MAKTSFVIKVASLISLVDPLSSSLQVIYVSHYHTMHKLGENPTIISRYLGKANYTSQQNLHFKFEKTSKYTN